ncbi:MAG: hypothetical protein Q9217_000932 [Psora testacea]
MPSVWGTGVPSFESFQQTVRNKAIPVDASVESLVSLLKRRQISGSRKCAEATAFLLRRVLESFGDGDISELLENVREVGQRLMAAQPREPAVGNVVRRVLGLIRVEAEEDRKGEVTTYSDTASESQSLSPTLEVPAPQMSLPVPSQLASSLLQRERDDDDTATLVTRTSQRPPLKVQPSQANSKAASMNTSMFSLLSHSISSLASPAARRGTQSSSVQPPLSFQALANLNAAKDLRAEILEGLEELVDEIRQADDQIASYALEHIHPHETLLTHSSSKTVQKFLLKAAAKRKFTVVHAEAYPNDHEATYESIVGKSKGNNVKRRLSDQFLKTLSAAGVTVILIPDSAIFALMARVSKVILDSHIALANGGLIASSGANVLAKAAKVHRTPVIVLSAVYKISPTYPFNKSAFMEDGDPSHVVSYQDGSFLRKVGVQNPLFDHVPADFVDLYVTNLGGHAALSTQRIVKDHYRDEDLDLDKIRISLEGPYMSN